VKTRFKLCPTCKEITPRAIGHFQFGLKRAIEKNLVAIEPLANQLQIDLDGPKALKIYGKQFSILKRAGLTVGWKERMTPSMSKGHLHLTITMPKNLNAELRICLQVILGSDLQREAFNLARVLNRQKYAICFFERENGK